MKLFSLLMTMALAGMNFCCASASAQVREIPPTFPIIDAGSKDGVGHVCPVIHPETGKLWIVTARHMVDDPPVPGLRLEADPGVIFDARVVWRDPIVDIAYLEPPDDIPLVAYLIGDRPNIEDIVWFVGYDWTNSKRAFQRTILNSKITYFAAGKIIYEPGGYFGSSGSCVVDENGFVVGINTNFMPFQSGPTSGQAWAFWKGLAFKGLEEGIAPPKQSVLECKDVPIWKVGEWLAACLLNK